MKKIISLLISFCLILAITPFNVLAAPNETTQSTDSNSNATQNVEPKVVVSDYGVQIDPNEIKGYSESNGNVENSPFGSIYTKAFGYEEALYMGMGGYFHLEGSANDDVPALDKNTSKNVGTTNMNAVQKGFKIKGTNSVITWDKIIYATAGTGDFNAELLNNGTVVLFATGGMPDNGSKENLKIYMAVFNPTDNATEIECISVAELPFGYIQSKYDLAPMLQVVTGNIINDKQNKQKISPDEFIVTYPSYTAKTGWYLKHVVYQVVSLTNNNCRISAFAYHSDIALDYGSKLVDLFIEDVNGDGVEDVLAVTSDGVTKLRINKLTKKQSVATVYVWKGGDTGYQYTAETVVNGFYRAGVVALDINKDGENEIAVCGIKDVIYDASNTVIISVNDAVTVFSWQDNTITSICSTEFTSNISSGYIDEIQTTFLVNPVVFATRQQYDVKSNSVTQSAKDSPIMLCYDGMLIKYSYDDKKLSHIKNGRESYMKADSVLYEGYSGMIYANAEGDDQEEIFLLYYKGNSRILSMHPDVSTQKRAYNGTRVGDTPIGCFTLANTDYDTGTLRYDDWEFTYTEPTAIAIVAAPPTFGDFLHVEENYIVMGNTTYTVSTTAGSSHSIDHAIGAIGHGSFLVGQADLKLQYTNTFTESKTTTKTTSFSATQETVVATCVIPVECYYYTILLATPDGVKEQPYIIPKSYDSVMTSMTIDEYDKLAKKYHKDVLKGNIVVHTDGDPITYNYPGYTDLQGNDAIRTSYNKGISGSQIEISSEEERQHGLSLSVDVMFGFELFGLGGYGGVAYDLNSAWGQINGSGTGYSGNVRNIPVEGIDDDYGFTWRLKAYNVSVDGKTIPFITYHVTNCSTNPRMPENVTAYGIEAYDDNGNLIPANKVYWQEYESNEKLDVHYEILRSREGFDGAFETVGTAPYGTNYFIDKEGLEFGKEYEYKVITAKNAPTAANAKSLESPVAKAKTLNKNGGLTVTTETPTLTVKASEIANIKVNVAGIQEGETVTYQWERRLFAKGWTTLTNANKAEYKIGAASPLWDKAIYRCLVKKKITLADGSTEWIYNYSDPIMLIVE